MFVPIGPADALLSCTLFAGNVIQGYVRARVVSFIYFYVSKHLPPRGSVGDVTFHSGYLSFPRLTPRHADGPREVFGMASPLY